MNLMGLNLVAKEGRWTGAWASERTCRYDAGRGRETGEENGYLPLGGWYTDGGLLRELGRLWGAIWGGGEEAYTCLSGIMSSHPDVARWPGEKYWPGTQVRNIKAQRDWG